MPYDNMPSAEGLSIIGILLASLLGSAHCALMCGGFVAVIQSGERSTMALIFYHLGRFITYITLGAVAGYLGKGINNLSGINALATIVAATWFVWQAVLVYLPKTPIKIGGARGRIAKIIEAAVGKPGILGIVTGLLPCGWLYSNIVLAGALGEPSYGAIYMAAFWLGTIPALQSVAFCSSIIRRVLPNRSRLLVSTLYLIFAILSLSLHLSLVGNEAKSSCHSHHEKHQHNK